MRSHIFIVFLLGIALQGFGQTPAPAAQELPRDPKAILAAAAPFYDFSDPTLKPWHLKAAYQLYDELGKPTEQGTYEYWWASPKVHRSTWTRSKAMYTEWSLADGSLRLKETGDPLRYFERNLRSLLLSPLSSRGTLESGKSKLGLRTVSIGQAQLNCVTTELEESYCFEPISAMIRLTLINLITAEYDHIVKTQNHYLAKQVTASVGQQTVFSVSIQTIDGIAFSDTALVPADDAVITDAADGPTDENQEGNKITMGTLTRKTEPIYPPVAKVAGAQGVVILGAIIGTDGKIRNLEALASPSRLLTGSALDCVKQWEYKPFMLNGVPVEVETTINVKYDLGR